MGARAFARFVLAFGMDPSCFLSDRRVKTHAPSEADALWLYVCHSLECMLTRIYRHTHTHIYICIHTYTSYIYIHTHILSNTFS